MTDVPAVLRKVVYSADCTCPLQKKYGDIVCIDGTLWGLTYSEMGPPDSRQALDDCPHCKKAKAVVQSNAKDATP